jgi:hypothetical protein
MKSGPVTARVMVRVRLYGGLRNRLGLRLLEWVLSRMLTVKVRLYIGGVE